MAKILVVFSHPAYQKSKVNKKLLQKVSGMENVTIHDLYERYPDFHIDVQKEQQLLIEHDVIVLQHPFYWYSMPALLKEWLDLVLGFGFAYGRNGNKLAGKWLLNTVTTGAGEAAYERNGEKELTRDKLFFAFSKLAGLCQMYYLPPLTVVGTHSLTEQDLDSIGMLYNMLLKRMVAGTFDFDEAMQTLTMNDYVKGWNHAS